MQPSGQGHASNHNVYDVYSRLDKTRSFRIEKYSTIHTHSLTSFTLSQSLRVQSLSLLPLKASHANRQAINFPSAHIMSQYPNPTPGNHPQQNYQYPQNPDNAFQTHQPPPQQNYTNVNSYPSQTTFPPQSYNSPKMEQPQATYQTPEKMSEKPQPHVPVQMHNQPKNGYGSKWLFGLFDCCSPFGTCCMTFWCPCKSIYDTVKEGY